MGQDLGFNVYASLRGWAHQRLEAPGSIDCLSLVTGATMEHSTFVNQVSCETEQSSVAGGARSTVESHSQNKRLPSRCSFPTWFSAAQHMQNAAYATTSL